MDVPSEKQKKYHCPFCQEDFSQKQPKRRFTYERIANRDVIGTNKVSWCASILCSLSEAYQGQGQQNQNRNQQGRNSLNG